VTTNQTWTDDDLTALLGELPDGSLDSIHEILTQETQNVLLSDVPLDKDERIAWAEQDILHFFRAYLSHYIKAPSPPFHQDLAGIALDIVLRRAPYDTKVGYVAAAPRGHAKSSLISLAIPLYCICFRKKRFVVIYSDTDEPQAQLIAMNIKAELDENELLRNDFGDLRGSTYGFTYNQQDFTAVHWEHGRSVHRTRVMSRGIFSRARGIRLKEQRPDLVLLDDCENDEMVSSDTQRDKVLQTYHRTIRPMIDPVNGSIMMVGTVLHQASLLRKMLDLAEDPDSEYEHGFWKAIDDDGNVLWPEWLSFEKLMALKAANSFAFQTEYQNDPIDDTTRVHRPEWLRWYTTTDIEYDHAERRWYYKKQPLTIYGFVDPAISEKDRADEFALVIAGVTRDRKNILVLYVWHGKIDFARQVSMCIAHAKQWNVRKLGIEKNGYQKVLTEETKSRLRNNKVYPVLRFTRKYDRIKGASPVYQQGIVLLRAAMDNEVGVLDELKKTRVHHTMYDFYKQLMYYPSSEHSDMVDAAAGMMHVAGGVATFAGYTGAPKSWRPSMPFLGENLLPQ